MKFEKTENRKPRQIIIQRLFRKRNDSRLSIEQTDRSIDRSFQRAERDRGRSWRFRGGKKGRRRRGGRGLKERKERRRRATGKAWKLMEVHWGSPRKERLVLRTLDTNPFFLYNLKTLSLRPFSESASVQRRKHWHCHEPYHSLSLAQFPSLPSLVDSILLVPPLAESRAHEAGSIRSLKCIPTRTTYYAHHKGVFALDDWTNRNGAVRSLSRIYPSSRRGRNVRQVSTSGMDSPRIVNPRVRRQPRIAREQPVFLAVERGTRQFNFAPDIHLSYLFRRIIFGNEISIYWANRFSRFWYIIRSFYLVEDIPLVIERMNICLYPDRFFRGLEKFIIFFIPS